MVASQSSLIWEHGAVTAKHNDTTHTTHTHTCSHTRTHTHTNTHSPSSGKQERSSCELHSSVQIEGDTGRLVNRHRCTELSRTESGRKRKVTLSQWEGSGKVNNTCCVTKATVKKNNNKKKKTCWSKWQKSIVLSSSSERLLYTFGENTN